MDYKAEGIKPYDEETDKTTQVREMFDSIAPAYDTMNRTMTLGIDRWWRWVAVKMLRRLIGGGLVRADGLLRQAGRMCDERRIK